MSALRGTGPHEVVALRHLFTKAPEGFPTGSGFNTVACAEDLKVMVRLVEEVVESYQSRDVNQPACRQLVRLPTAADAYALTVFTPLADSPDTRSGNFWAETLVVPGQWLKKGDWDAAAAFDSLPWWGRRPLDSLPRELEREPLPVLEPGSPSRLARLIKLVPSDILPTLLRALVQQSNGLQRLRVVEAQSGRHEDLAEVIMLLPLVVPPTHRLYPENDLHHCLTLRTRSPAGGMSPAADLTGHPAAETADFLDDIVIDLSNRRPVPKLANNFGLDYVKWLLGILNNEDWETLSLLYKRAEGAPGPTFFSTFSTLLPPRQEKGRRSPNKAAAPAPVGPDVCAQAAEEPPTEAPQPKIQAIPAEVAVRPLPAQEATAPSPAGTPPSGGAAQERISSPIQDRQRAWAARDQTEGALWNVLESHKSQLEELTRKIRQDFAAELEKTHKKLLEDVAGLRRDLEVNLQSVEKDIKNAGKRTQQQSASLVKESSTFKTKLESLEREIVEVKNRVSQLASITPEAGAVITVLKPSKGRRSFRDMLVLSRDWLRGRRWIAWGAGIGIVVAVLVAVGLPRLVQISPKSFTPIEELARRSREDALVQRILPGAVAVHLLESAAKREDVYRRAHAETLTIALSHGIQIVSNLDCALLQAALRSQEPAISVDGGCGPGTIAALDAAPKADCCRNFPKADAQGSKKLWNCFMIGYLRLAPSEPGQQKEDCLGESPWREGRRWTEDEAARALSLFQTAAQVAKGGPGSDLAKSLQNLDPSQSSSLRDSIASENLTPDEARRVLMLVWAASGNLEDRLEQLTISQLEELDWLVGQLTAEDLPGNGSTDASSGAQ